MDSWKIQTSKEIKEIHHLLESQFGFTGKLEYGFLLNSQHNLYIVARDVANIDWKTLRIKSAGMYFAEWKTGIRLSIEGSQLVGPSSNKNILEITELEAMHWLKGQDIPAPKEMRGYVLLKCGNDFFGCGSVKEGVVMNFVPKIRRLPSNA